MSKSIAEFVREVRQEGMRVTWPSRKETTMTTIVVFIMIFIMAIILFCVDWMIATAIEFILG